MTDRSKAPEQFEAKFEKLRAWGFASGSYHCFCSECGKTHTADKRAWRCLECAEARTDLIEARVSAEVEAALRKAAKVELEYPKFQSVEYQAGWDAALLEIQEAILALIDQPSALDEMLAEKDTKIAELTEIAETLSGAVEYNYHGEVQDPDEREAIARLDLICNTPKED